MKTRINPDSTMSGLLYRDETHQLIDLCMEIYQELGKGYDEAICRGAFVVDLSRQTIPFTCAKKCGSAYKGVISSMSAAILWNESPSYYEAVLICEICGKSSD